MDVTQLQEGLNEGKFTSVDLVNIFGDRCQSIGRGLNLTTQENFKNALAMAQEKDEERARAKSEGTELGLLHGIPISVKDSIFQKGFLATYGFAHLCDDIL